MRNVSTGLCLDTDALVAAELSTTLFDASEITSADHGGTAGPRPRGVARTVWFELARCHSVTRIDR
jgi:hypothetical protein